MGLPSSPDKGLESAAADPRKASNPPDLWHPSLRSWLEALPEGHGRAAAFETRFPFSSGGAMATILRGLERAGYRAIARG